MPPVPDLAIETLRDAYAAGADPAETIDRVYDAIAAADDPGIFITLVDRDQARQAAKALASFDAAKPLWGVPFAVKDNIDVEGLPTTAACPDYAYTPAVSAPAVERLLAAGAILVGKTNLDQFATGLVGVRTPYPVPRNACDPALVPGGSSSGSAVAVARGLVSLALGTDTAGSGRVPAALNAIVGLKPTRGAIPIRGVVPACRTLDCVSVFAGTAADAFAAFAVAAGYDAADPYSRPVALGRPALPAPTGEAAASAAPRPRPPSMRRWRSFPTSARRRGRSISRRSLRPPRFSTRVPGSPSAMRRSTPSSKRSRRHFTR